MIISSKGRYGVRAMFVLAQRYAQGPQSIKQIAAQEALSETYLEQLFAKLRASGLVVSARGAGGGYRLARSPATISVGEILIALEGPLSPADCVLDSCENSHDCATHAIWCRIYEGINSVVNSITLQDMLDDYAAQHSACRTGRTSVKCR